MRKTCFFILLFLLQTLQAQDTLKVKPVLTNDTINLSVVKDSLTTENSNDSILELYSDSDTLRLMITNDTIHEVVPRSMAMPESRDTITNLMANDSIIQTDSIRMDSTLIQVKDSIRLDSLSIDSIRSKLDLNALDSLMEKATKDSIRRKEVEDSIRRANPPKKKVKKKRVNPILIRYNKEMAALRTSYFAYFRMWDDLDAPAPHVKYNPDFYKLFVVPTFYKSAFTQAYGISWEPKTDFRAESADSLYRSLKIKEDSLVYSVPCVETKKKADLWSNAILLQYYMEHPEMVTGNEAYLADLKIMDESKAIIKKEPEKIITLLEPETPFVENINADNEFIKLKPNFWKFAGNSSMQFTQNYISDNWYQGGESTNALVSDLILNANYNNRQHGIEFDNKMEIKIGFTTAPSDTMHSYRTNADLFRLNSKIGVRAIKNWYYTVATEFKTQFFSNYKMNSNEKVSSFMTPAYFNASVGMDFKQNKKNLNLSLMAMPFSYNLIYIHDKDITKDKAAFGVEKGKRSENMFGSEIKGNITWTIIRNVQWTSVFRYFTTYENVMVNWENTFNFILNRHLSTKLFLHARYDDNVKLTEENHTHFQFKEMLMFGLNYSW